jgi:hypothetical protein
MIPCPYTREHDRQLIDLQPSHNGNKEYNGSCAIEYLDQYFLVQKFFYKTSFWFPCSKHL